MLSQLQALIPHPAAAFAGPHAIHVWRWEGFHLWGRTKQSMTAHSLVHREPFSSRMALRMLRNIVIGFLVFLIVGNALIFLFFKWASMTSADRSLPALPGIENLAEVDTRLWRGSAPSRPGYAALAAHDVTTIVDLRAEDIFVDENYINSLGMNLVRMPLRDGQAPTPAMADRFLAMMKETEGRVFIHCGAGVGRTGTLAAAYLVDSGEAGALSALARNLAVGPPSLEQILFAASLEKGETHSSNPLFTAVSRVLDAPRRTLVLIRNSYGN